MSALITNSHRLDIDSGEHNRIRTTVVSGTVTLSARDNTDHTILDLTADQARELGTKLITFAAYAEANKLQMRS